MNSRPPADKVGAINWNRRALSFGTAGRNPSEPPGAFLRIRWAESSEYAAPADFAKLIAQCRQTEWDVYVQPPFAGPETVLDYLARYTHRIAISNHRLLDVRDGKVTFSYKDYKTGDNKTMTLDACKFIRRFLMHVLPSGFQRIRYYGFLANRHRAQNLELCRRLLHVAPAIPSPGMQKAALLEVLLGTDPAICPRCQKGRLFRSDTFTPTLSALEQGVKGGVTLCGTRTVFTGTGLGSRQTVISMQPLTGEPYAGKPHVRFGGRGGRRTDLPSPYNTGVHQLKISQ